MPESCVSRSSSGRDGFLSYDLLGLTVAFDRTYRVPMADLWACLTQPDRMAGWLGPVEEIDLRVGGRIVACLHPQNGAWLHGEILALEGGRRLEFTWTVPAHGQTPEFSGTVLALGLGPAPGGGSRLLFRHRGVPQQRVPDLFAASHLRLDQLPTMPGARAVVDRQRFLALRELYAADFSLGKETA